MPDPAAKPTWRRAPAPGGMPNRPVGIITSTATPGRNASCAQAENTPPSMRLIAMRNSPSSAPEQIE